MSSNDVSSQPPAQSSQTDGRKQAAKAQKEERNNMLNQLIESTEWKDTDNFIVEDDILKQIKGYDTALFSVDMLRKICNKLGFVSRKFTKNVCTDTIVKAVKDRMVYDAIDPQQSKTTDSTSMRCRLLNVIMSDLFVSRLQHLGARKEMAELNKGGAGQDKTFWEDVTLEFNDYDEEKVEYGELALTTAFDKKLFEEKKIDPSIKVKDQSWEALREMFIAMQKDYKKKHQRFKTSGNHSNNFHDFCHGRLDTYYMHVWLSQRDPNLLESIVEDLPEEVKFETIGDEDNNTNNSSITSRRKRKTPADVLEMHIRQREEKRGGDDVLKAQKAVAYQLKSYCMGMNQLIDLSKVNTATQTLEQFELVQRMKNTIGIAVSTMEGHIQAGTVWCPTTAAEAQPSTHKTPKTRNSSASSSRGLASSATESENNNSVARRIFAVGSDEKQKSSEAPSLAEATATQDDESSVGSDEPRFCCAEDYCWKKDNPKNFTCLCSICTGNCHVYCSKTNDRGYLMCEKCIKENL